MYTVKGLSACILDAEIHAPRVPENKVIPHTPIIFWEEDSKENQKK